MTTTGHHDASTQPTTIEHDEQTLKDQCDPTDRGFEGPAFTPAEALLAHFGRWHGDDLDELLDEVYQTRGKVRF